MFTFEDLIIYQDSLNFIDNVYNLTSHWPKEEMFGLTSQFRRASTSIALNIAEGSSRTKKDFRHFLDLTRGSIYECATILKIAKSRTYITSNEYELCYEECNKLARMASKLKSSLL